MRAEFMLKLLYVFGCLGLALRPAGAVFLQECEGVIISRVPNPNQECSEFVHCDGDNSYYCNDDCAEAVSCYEEEGKEPVGQTTTTRSPPATDGTTRPPSSPSSTTTSSGSSPRSTFAPPSTSSSTLPPPSTSTTTSGNLQQICKSGSGKNGSVYPYPANDNYYYQCLAGYLLLHQCPQHFHFDAARGQCIGPKPYLL